MPVLRLVTTNEPAPEWTLDTVASVLERGPMLEGFRRARCPAHDDRWGTLIMCEVEPGDIAFHCSGGCTEDRIRQAVEHRMAEAA